MATKPQSQMSSESATMGLGDEHDLRAYRLFRDAYLAFMDECSRVWHLHCHTVAVLEDSARSRLSKFETSPSPNDLALIQTELAEAHRKQAEDTRAGLERAVRAYANSTAAAWQASAEQKNPEWLMWNVGVGQMNAASAYSTVLRFLRG